MKILDEYTTLKKIIKDRCSLSRFGDGELNLLVGRKQIWQKPSLNLSMVLKEILNNKSINNFIVGIPRIEQGNLSFNNKFWKKYTNSFYTRFYNKEIQYYSSFITRPDIVPDLCVKQYWNLMRKIWDNRDVVLLEGDNKERKFVVDGKPNLLSNAKSIKIFYGKTMQAYTWAYTYEKMLCTCPKDSLILLSLGPTATVLAYKMTKLGYQAIDIGEAGMFYNRTHPKTPPEMKNAIDK